MQRLSPLRFFKRKAKKQESNRCQRQKVNTLTMEYFLSICTRSEIQTTSEVGWISKNYFILTLNNDYYLIKLNNSELISVKGGISFGRQQVSSSVFCSLIRRPKHYKHHGQLEIK